jgi:hypothetical protein
LDKPNPTLLYGRGSVWSIFQSRDREGAFDFVFARIRDRIYEAVYQAKPGMIELAWMLKALYRLKTLNRDTSQRVR